MHSIMAAFAIAFLTVDPDPPKAIVVPLKHAPAAEAARRLTNRLRDDGGVRITFNEKNNNVSIDGRRQTLRRAREFLWQLDERHRSDNAIVLIRLQHADAARTAALVNTLLPLVTLLDEDFNVHVVPNPPTNGILLLGNVVDRERIAALLEWLDGKRK